MDASTAVTLDPEKSYEIVDGQAEEKEMAGARHGRVVMRLGARLEMHAEQHQLGGIYGPDTTFQIGRNERLPDLAFVSAARMPEDGEPEGLWPIAPDLAIEVISPNDLWEKVQSKVQEYFAAGVRQVWLVSWQQRTVSIYDSPTHVTILTEEDTLTSVALLPDFSCRVSDIFQRPARS
jgi:Uma2 family endonuclease